MAKSPLPAEKAAMAVENTLSLIDSQTLNFTVNRNISSIPNAGKIEWTASFHEN